MSGLIPGYNRIRINDTRKKEIFDKEGIVKTKGNNYVIRIKNEGKGRYICPYVSLAIFKKKKDAELFYENYLNELANVH